MKRAPSTGPVRAAPPAGASAAAAASSSASASSSSSSSSSSSAAQPANKLLDLHEFLANADFLGAATLLEFQMRTGEGGVTALEWLGYAAFHGGELRRAIGAYNELLDISAQQEDARLSGQPLTSQLQQPAMSHATLLLCKSACLYGLGLYAEADECVTQAAAVEARTGAAGAGVATGNLRLRLLFHLAHKEGKEQALLSYHQRLSQSSQGGTGQGAREDQMSLAAMHFGRSHFQEATDIYKRLLLENREDLALNAYIALCYYKLDYYDVSLEILAVYLQARPLSPAAINLKACNHFRLFNGKAAEAELKALGDHSFLIEDSALMRHNLVVFRNGEGSLRVLPPLVGVVPEARLNLVIFHLRQGAVADAYALIKDLEPSIPQEYILKAVVNAAVGQRASSREHLKTSQQYYNLVGASASECDTIPGRQCMASCFFLRRQFEDVQIYLSSIKPYLYNDDDFNWNYGLTLAAVGNYKDAEETLLLVQSHALTSDFCFVSWLARCFIMNRKARQAWELYLRLDTSPDSLSLLQLIANDCYRTGAFVFAAKAFDVLERMDTGSGSDVEYWEGKRGACVGVLQQVIAGSETRDALREVVAMLRQTQNQQVQHILGIIGRYAQSTGGL